MLNQGGILAKLNRAGDFYFYFFLIINLLPVLIFKFFPTVDGPAHLYNSKLIVELFGQNNLLDDYFIFNAVSPNWLGHIILSFFHLIFPAYLAEKCLLVIFLIGFPISFRAFLKVQVYYNNTIVYFIFPFVYSFLLFYGFYNFQLGLVLFFWALYLLVKYNNEYTIKRTLLLLILSTLMCLSHLFVFAVFLFVVAILNIREIKILYNPDKEKRKQFFKNLIHQFFAFSIGLGFMIKFVFTNDINNTAPTFLKSSALLKWLMQVQPAKGILYAKEDIFTRWIFISLLLLISYLLFVTIKRYFFTKKQDSSLSIFRAKNNIWLLVSIIFLLALFVFPDSKGAAIGFVSSRITLFFFLFLITWLSTKKFPFWLHVLVFIIINYVNISLLNIYFSSTKEYEIVTNEISKASLKIESFKTVLPITNSDYWLHKHISNYLGIDKPMVILENYEASLDHFPLKWNWDEIPDLKFGEMSSADECLFWAGNMGNEFSDIDYVFVLNGEQETISGECKQEIYEVLANDYIEVYRSENNQILLYKYTQTH